MKKFVKKFLTIVVLISYVLLQFPVTLLAQGNDNNLNDGDIVGTNPVTSTKDANGVELKKTISKTSNSNEYEVTLEVKGENQVATTSTEVPIYTVIVFDRSGSMQNHCKGLLFDHDLGSGEKCPKGTIKGTVYKKWTNAVAGARSFARILNSRIPNAQIALVTFSDESSVNRGFAASNLDSVSFGEPDGGTNITDGLISAKNLLDSAPENAKKVVVFVGDGAPTYGVDSNGDIIGNGSSTTQRIIDNTLGKASELKSNGIEIYSIGYDDTYYPMDQDEINILKSIATDASHYSYSNPDAISTSLNNLITSISVMPAGTNATITDTIGDGFEYVEGSASDAATLSEDKTTIKFNVGELTETGKTVSFKIRLKDNLQPGEYDTNNTSNDGVNVKYDSYNGEKETNSINESSKVYHNPDLSYTVKYYKDSVSDSNFITEETGTGKMDDPITVNKNLNVKGYVCNDNEQYTINKNDQIVTIIYTRKNNLSYIVQYFKELVNGEEKLSDDNDNTVTGKTYLEEVYENQINKNKYYSTLPIFGYKEGNFKTDMPYTIDDGENIIKVCYERRNDLSYTVKYVDENNEEILQSELRENKTYNETYEESAKEAPEGYVLDDDATKTITLDKEVNELVFKYNIRTDYKYTVKYVDQDDEELLPSELRDNNTYNETYEENAKEAPEGYVLDDDATKTITLDKDNKELVFKYSIRTDYKYTVKYVDENDEELLPSVLRDNNTYNETYTEVAEVIEGYELTSDNTQSITMDEDNKELVFTYKIIKVTYTINEYYDDELTNTYDKVVNYGEELTFEEKDGYTLEVEYLDDNVINLYYTSIKTETYEVPPKTNVNNTYYLYLLLSLIIVGLVKVKKLD